MRHRNVTGNGRKRLFDFIGCRDIEYLDQKPRSSRRSFGSNWRPSLQSALACREARERAITEASRGLGTVQHDLHHAPHEEPGEKCKPDLKV